MAVTLSITGVPVQPVWLDGWDVIDGESAEIVSVAASLVAGQKDELAASLATDGQTQSGLVTAMRARITTAPLDPAPQQALSTYLAGGGAWTGSAEQVATRGAGLARLLVGSAEYQLI